MLTVIALAMQALCGDLDASVKIASQVKAQQAILKAACGEPSLQLAQLVSLEYLLGVALPSRTKEVHKPTGSIAESYHRIVFIWLHEISSATHLEERVWLALMQTSYHTLRRCAFLANALHG